MWTMRHGTLVGPDTAVVQVDLDAAAIGAHQRADLGVLGDVAATARAAADPALERSGPTTPGYRSARLRERIAREVRWRDVPFRDESDGDRVDPRTLSIGSMTCCPPSAWWRSIQATSWATRACTCRSPTRTASASPRRPGFPPASRSAVGAGPRARWQEPGGFGARPAAHAPPSRDQLTSGAPGQAFHADARAGESPRPGIGVLLPATCRRLRSLPS
jgi:hypothetical protein